MQLEGGSEGVCLGSSRRQEVRRREQQDYGLKQGTQTASAELSPVAARAAVVEHDPLQLRKPAATAGPATKRDQVVAARLALAAGNDGRTPDRPRPGPFASPRRQSSDAPAIPQHAPTDRRAGPADRIKQRRTPPNRSKEEGKRKNCITSPLK
jgi:hypothetical protein